jgi:hypothetical protein
MRFKASRFSFGAGVAICVLVGCAPSAGSGAGGGGGTEQSSSASTCGDSSAGGAGGGGAGVGGDPDETAGGGGAGKVPCDQGYGGAPVGSSYDAGPVCAARFCQEGEEAFACGEALHCDCPDPAAHCTPARGGQVAGHSDGTKITPETATAWCVGPATGCPPAPPPAMLATRRHARPRWE